MTFAETTRHYTTHKHTRIMNTMILAELLNRVGEEHCSRHLDDFGLERAGRVADFYNNGGLEMRFGGVNYALQYASVTDGRVEIGVWAWMDDEDFDEDATFEVYDGEDFTPEELQVVYDKVVEIYGCE